MCVQIESPDNPVLQEDIERLAKKAELFSALRGSRVFVTGATGLIGSQVVKTLLSLNRLHGFEIKVAALVRSEEKAKRVFPYASGRTDLELVFGDMGNPLEYEGEIDYIIHGASVTSSKFFVSNPVETIDIAVNGTKRVLELAKEKKVKGMVYLSSLEVYGIPPAECETVSEKDYGYIDPLSVRSSYSEGKRMIECLCVSYAKEYGVPVKIARLSQTFGAGVEYQDGRVFAEFARAVIEKRDIVLHTEGKTVRSYCYTTDAVAAIFTILIKGGVSEAYNVTNMQTAVSIYEMAELVCGLRPETGIRVIKEIPEDVSGFGYNPEMVIRLNSKKLEELGWEATVGLKEMFERLIADFEFHEDKNAVH